MSGWLPIMTAPKAGVRVLLSVPWSGGPKVEIGKHHERVEILDGVEVRRRACWDLDRMPLMIEDLPEPTHWMPLPQPPS